MQHKSSHEKTASAKLTFVVLSDAERPSRTFKASRFQLALVIFLGFVAVGAISTVALIYTPLGRLVLPAYFSTQAEQLEKMRILESKVNDVEKQITYLTAYNVKLRNVLGDSVIADTTEFAATNQSEGSAQQQVSKEVSNEYTATYQPVSAGTYNSTYSNEDANSILPLMMPVAGFVTRGVDYAKQHYGIDISAQEGEPIVAPAPGEVLFSDWTLTGGNTLIIAHAGDFITVYKHCERALVAVGTKVSRGEAIALVGSTGVTSTGPHLHFELWQNGKNLNPENYLIVKN